MPWARLGILIERAYPKRAPKGGRAPLPIETMLRIHLKQQRLALSDPAIEKALHDVPAMGSFAQLDAGNDCIPDESTILCFPIVCRSIS